VIKFVSEKDYSNRYRDVYRFVKMDDNTYKFEMDGDSMQWCRFGGKEGQQEIDTNDLGMFDPSGGPFLSVGDFEVDNRKVKRIFSGDYVGVEVE
jgi:hypothetical protein